MPNAKILSEKQAYVAALADRMKNSAAGVFVDYKGINVAEDTELRTILRNIGVEYSVIKNNMAKRAITEIDGFEVLDPIFNGTTSLATCEKDPIAPVKAISDYARKLSDKFEIKAGFVEGKVLSLDELREIATLGSKEGLYSRVLGTMLAPITSLAIVLSQIAEQRGGSAAPAEEAAPAEAAPAEDAPAEAPAEDAPAE